MGIQPFICSHTWLYVGVYNSTQAIICSQSNYFQLCLPALPTNSKSDSASLSNNDNYEKNLEHNYTFC